MAEEFERRSPVFDWEKGDFALDPGGNVITTTEGPAAMQIILKALQTTRGVFAIYANLEDEDLDHKYGSDIPDILRDHSISLSVKEDEIKRAIEEALVYIDWVSSVDNVEFNLKPGEINAVEISCDVVTIFDEVLEVRGLDING
ncbi:DUF2634 domain-containing protein [Cytobacillus kochii]|uniref:DUF2634 domain-containing protein n=1 Tax=Cytobacillus kochii TaxID=859143 RepID=UPI00402A82FE